MIFSLLVNCPPSSSAARNALGFARASLDAGHQIFRVFFFGEGALHASDRLNVATGTLQPGIEWQQLAAAHDIDLVACVGSAHRHGVLDHATAARLQLSSNVADGYAISGLGQLVEASTRSDRVISFG